MSCRANDGNSATTSLAKFLTRTKEDVVSHVFHQVRAEGMASYGRAEGGQKQGLLPADPAAVSAFLDQSRLLARHDPRVPDAWRTSLLDRIDRAQQSAIAGDVPNLATFHAWTHLVDRLESEPAASRRGAAAAMPEEDPTSGVTPDGLVITSAEVDLARSEYQRLRARFQRLQDEGALARRGSEERKFRTLELATARDRYERLAEAYDATDTGYAALLESPARLARDPNHAHWQERRSRAESRRAAVAPASAAKNAAALDGGQTRQERDTAREIVRKAEAAYRLSPTVRARSRYEAATKDYQGKQRSYLFTLTSRADVADAVSTGDMKSAQAWAGLSGDDEVSRIDLWRAAEAHTADKDAAEVRIGRLGEVEAIRRSLARAEARQTVLDAEGNGEIDAINRRFAESLRRRRGGAVA